MVQPLLSEFPRTFGKQLEYILFDALPLLGTVARVEAVKKEIFLMLREMIVFTFLGRHNPISVFEIGIKWIDVNATDDNGFTLLMLAVVHACPHFVRLLLAKKSLEVNLTNKDGRSALDLLDTNCATSDQLVKLFLERQAAFKDVDFSKMEMSLLVKSLIMDSFDLANSLLDSSSYHASPSELTTARGILAAAMRALLFHHTEDSVSAEKKKSLLKLLYKVETKERCEEERRKQGAT